MSLATTGSIPDFKYGWAEDGGNINSMISPPLAVFVSWIPLLKMLSLTEVLYRGHIYILTALLLPEILSDKAGGIVNQNSVPKFDFPIPDSSSFKISFFNWDSADIGNII